MEYLTNDYLTRSLPPAIEGSGCGSRHRERRTWEVPGGRREAGEFIADTAARELREETGAVEFTLTPVAIYCVSRGETESYGQLFLADVQRLGDLPLSEIEEVRLFTDVPGELTYPLIQPHLHAKVTAMFPLASQDNP